jgi:hypothetical protein
MTRFKKLATAMVGAALIGAAAPAVALPTLATPDGVADPFGGFDWNPSASAVVTGFAPVTGTIITTTYFANAVDINLLGGGIFATPNMFPPAGTYEYTVLAVITESVTCLIPGCASANFTTLGGSWAIWFDTSPDSNLVSGIGITDGTLLLAGDMNPGFAGNFTADGMGGGVGVFQFTGDVTFTNLAFIAPALNTSNAVATLQFGTSTTNWTAPSGLPAGGGGSTPFPVGAGCNVLSGPLCFQADGNQAFHVVPEPGTLALLAVGLLLVAGLGRRRQR